MPDISLTTFIDFVHASGTSRITVIRQAKRLYEQGYRPAFDYWKPLRDAIVDVHRGGHLPSSLDAVVAAAHSRQKVNYARCVAAYKRWMGRRPFQWTGSQSADWQNGNLAVRVNPELGVQINGGPYLIKLYFKAQQLSKRRIDTMLHLMSKVLPGIGGGATPAVMDVPRGRLVTPTVTVAGIGALLVGEARAFSAMWRLVK